MRLSECFHCKDFPCLDVRHDAFRLPQFEIDAQVVRVVLISEAAPLEAGDDYYAGPQALFEQTTLLAFEDAGYPAASALELLGRGIYLTRAVKCAKTGYGIQTGTIKTCSRLLEAELDLFPNVRAWLLMGDVAIKALNEIARRQGLGRVIPAGSTYKLRGPEYTYRGARAFPSYLQAGPSFGIEKSKRKMIAEDIRAAMSAAGIER